MGTRAEQTSDHVCNWGSFQEFSGRKVLAGSSSNSLALKSSLGLPSWARPSSLILLSPLPSAPSTFPGPGLTPCCSPPPAAVFLEVEANIIAAVKPRSCPRPRQSPQPNRPPLGVSVDVCSLLKPLGVWVSVCLLTGRRICSFDPAPPECWPLPLIILRAPRAGPRRAAFCTEGSASTPGRSLIQCCYRSRLKIAKVMS